MGWSDLSELDVPTLILHGSDDRVVPVENGRLLDDRIRDARLEIDGGGHHLFFVEEASRANEHLQDFLASNRLPEYEREGATMTASERDRR